MNQEDRISIYTIPPNFAEEGTLLSGRIKTRNAVETAVLLLILVPVILSLSVSGKTKLYIGMIVLVPVVILGVIGVQGESLFVFIASFFRYLRRRRRLAVPDERYRMELNRRKGKKQRGGKNRSDRKQRKSGRNRAKPKTDEPKVAEKIKADKKRVKTGKKAWISKRTQKARKEQTSETESEG